jgi:hypothetical protein
VPAITAPVHQVFQAVGQSPQQTWLYVKMLKTKKLKTLAASKTTGDNLEKSHS